MNIPSPFSERQMDYFRASLGAWFNVAEGGKRGGKNVLTVMVFCSLLETHKDKIHLVGGVSGATAKLNILDCDGYGLLNYFEGRCREGKYKDRDCLYIQTKVGEKVILVSGGGKDGDEKLIKGNTYGMAYITEANECHPKFIKEVFDRTISSSDRKVFHDLNPKEPEHWYYKDVLDFHQEQQNLDADYGYNYGHFTLVDNMALSNEKIKKVLKTYKKGTVWYDRDIKGLRTVAEGIIFRYFADNDEPFLFDDKDIKDTTFSKLVMGVDFGGNGSKTTFVLNGYINGYKDFRILEEDGLPLTEDIGAEQICDKFVEFSKLCLARYRTIDWVFPDSASTTMINSLISRAKKEGLPFWNKITGCRKNEISQRPRTIDMLLTSGRLKINRRCESVRTALKSLRWDEKKPDIPEDKNIGNCNDWYDAFCYTLLDFIEYIDLDR